MVDLLTGQLEAEIVIEFDLITFRLLVKCGCGVPINLRQIDNLLTENFPCV